MVGISEHAWNVAHQALGPAVAAAAIALIYEKHANGEVSSPSGYLRGMVEKAMLGELHLDRSFFGRLSQKDAKRCRNLIQQIRCWIVRNLDVIVILLRLREAAVE